MDTNEHQLAFADGLCLLISPNGRWETFPWRSRFPKTVRGKAAVKTRITPASRMVTNFRSPQPIGVNS
jgi:hypothetical protein